MRSPRHSRAEKEQWEKKNYIDPKLYKEYNVKRGPAGRGRPRGRADRSDPGGRDPVLQRHRGEHIIPSGMLLLPGHRLPGAGEKGPRGAASP